MIEIFNENGEVREYLTVAERMQDFLERYGPQAGYSIQTRVRDYFGIHQGVSDLYSAALSAGADASGLPSIDLTLFRFDAQLIDEDGRVMAEASALRRINTDLDATLYARLWEAGETAALQRLMARVGYGSDTLLADELSDIDERGVPYARKEEGSAGPATSEPQGERPSSATAPSPASATKSSPSEDSEPEQSHEAAPAAGEAKPSGSEEKTAAKAPRKAASMPGDRKPEGPAISEVSEALLRQIRHLASVRGIEPPEVSNKTEAKEALRQLRKTAAAQ